MIEDKIINPLPDMTVSVTMSGVTILSQSSFNKRYDLPKDVYHIKQTNFDTKESYQPNFTGDNPWRWEQAKKELEAKKRKKSVQKLSVTLVKKEKALRSYTINKKQVCHKIKGFLNQQKGMKQLYFWTVTFPQGTSDDVAFILFNKWLTRLRFEKMLKSYLWVSERQQNGTIHFHIAIPHKMDVKKSNRFMRAAIFTCIDQKEIRFSREQAKNYNGIDLAKDRKTRRVTNFAKRKKEKSLSNYLTKYVTKNNETFKHLAWHCSRDYSNIVISIRLTPTEVLSLNLNQFISEEKVLINEWFTFKRWKTDTPLPIKKHLAFINQSIQSLLNLN